MYLFFTGIKIRVSKPVCGGVFYFINSASSENVNHIDSVIIMDRSIQFCCIGELSIEESADKTSFNHVERPDRNRMNKLEIHHILRLCFLNLICCLILSYFIC